MTVSILLYAACAAVYFLLGVGILANGRANRKHVMLAASCLVTAVWAVGVAWGDDRLRDMLELARTFAWFGFIMHLYRRAVSSGSKLGRSLAWLGGLTILAVAILTLYGASRGMDVVLSSIVIQARLVLAVCMLLLIENLYRNVPEDLRWHVALPCIGLGGLFVYDIFFLSDVLLFRHISIALLCARAAVTTMVAPLLAISAWRNQRHWGSAIQVSHRAVFYSASLIVIGVFLVGLASAGEILRRFGDGRSGNWATVFEISLMCGGILLTAVLLTSSTAQSSLRHLVINNFLSRRYDYRMEWLRCIKTLSQAESYVGLHLRAIKAVADTVDSPAGMVFLCESDGGGFRWAGSWNLPAASALVPVDHPLIPMFRGGHWLVEAPDGVPWVEDRAAPWLAVPLSHSGRLIGFVLVSPSRAPFTLDTEAYGLLRIVAQEVASYIAEQRAAQAMLQARQMQEYGQRFAFVAHDIKNVASQLALLLSNAERHINNPEFQQDMLGTVGASVQKITTLLLRLKAPQGEPPPAVLAVNDRLETVIRANSPARRARIDLNVDPSLADAMVAMASGAFEAVVTHLLDNAFEASAPEARVRISCTSIACTLQIDIADHGCGMTPEFISNQLFQPFRSSKRDGFGIGVYQARELMRRANGELAVISTPGDGTTMRLSFPVATVPSPEQTVMQAFL